MQDKIKILKAKLKELEDAGEKFTLEWYDVKTIINELEDRYANTESN